MAELRILTDLERTSPPDDDWAREVCKIGQGAATCRFLTAGTNGLSCERLTNIGVQLTIRAANGTMVARADNCEGRLSV